MFTKCAYIRKCLDVWQRIKKKKKKNLTESPLTRFWAFIYISQPSSADGVCLFILFFLVFCQTTVSKVKNELLRSVNVVTVLFNNHLWLQFELFIGKKSYIYGNQYLIVIPRGTQMCDENVWIAQTKVALYITVRTKVDWTWNAIIAVLSVSSTPWWCWC